MTEPARELSLDDHAEIAAQALARQVLGRVPTPDEAAAMALIFRSAAQALKHGFITRLAEHVQAERDDERVEEFFENIKPD